MWKIFPILKNEGISIFFSTTQNHSGKDSKQKNLGVTLELYMSDTKKVTSFFLLFIFIKVATILQSLKNIKHVACLLSVNPNNWKR